MTSVDPDLMLLERFRQTGDSEAFAEIVRRYAGAVFATCHRILHDPGSAEDAAQETFFRLMTRPHRVTASLGGWLHRAATRLALDIRRSDTSRRRREAAYEIPQPPEASSWADVAPKLDQALSVLPDEQRELLVRHFLRGESQAEMAAQAGMSAATMSRRMKAAVDVLRQELAGRGLAVAPLVLMNLLSHNGVALAPAALKNALGKMTLYCTARPASLAAAKGSMSLMSMLRGLPRVVYAARWGMAALTFSLAVTTVGTFALQRACLRTDGAHQNKVNLHAMDPQPVEMSRSTEVNH